MSTMSDKFIGDTSIGKKSVGIGKKSVGISNKSVGENIVFNKIKANTLDENLSYKRTPPRQPRAGVAAVMSGFAMAIATMTVAGVSVLATPSPALAQSWMKDFFGDPEAHSRRSRGARNKSAVADRPSANEPLISSQTLQSIDRAIGLYEQIVKNGGWKPIPGKGSIRPGGDNRRVSALRERLRASGDLPARAPKGGNFDNTLQTAVAQYQTRVGLTASGTVNNQTLEMLQVSAQHRLTQLRENRKRISKALRHAKAARYIVVNVPSYELQAVDNGRVAIYSRTIVGKPSTPTPELVASVRAINLLPYWHVPGTIARRALIPKLKKDPLYLAREHIRVFSSWGGEEIDPGTVNWFGPEAKRYVFRQDPGTFNALGVVRIDMPNSHIVYMHDTPMKPLFKYAMRPYSAGCVRVQKALDVAAWLVAPDTGMSTARLQQMIGQGSRETFKLKQRVPVLFTYITAWGTREGRVLFRSDIYDKDPHKTRMASIAPWGKADVHVMP